VTKEERMMRLGKTVLGVGLSLWLASGAGAEDSHEKRALLGPELMLLSNPQVRADLALTPQQIQKIDALTAGFQADASRAMGDKKGPPDEAVVASLDDEVAAYTRELGNALTPEQRQRVRQIQIQMVGNVALLEPAIQKRVGLSSEETQKVDAAAQGNVGKVKELRKKLALGEVSPQAFRTEVAELGRELDRSLGEAASAETRAKLKELGGKPFAGALH
jgi:hypothetical protein